jgi:hypothetical protein
MGNWFVTAPLLVHMQTKRNLQKALDPAGTGTSDRPARNLVAIATTLSRLQDWWVIINIVGEVRESGGCHSLGETE